MTEPAPQTEQPKDQLNLAERIRARFAPFGGVDLELPPRDATREPPDFSGPEYDQPAIDREDS